MVDMLSCCLTDRTSLQGRILSHSLAEEGRNICKQDSKMLAVHIVTKTQNLTVRLEKELIKKIEEEAQHEKTDKSTVARKLITVGIEQTQKARALEEYRRGRYTIWKASE